MLRAFLSMLCGPGLGCTDIESLRETIVDCELDFAFLVAPDASALQTDGPSACGKSPPKTASLLPFTATRIP